MVNAWCDRRYSSVQQTVVIYRSSLWEQFSVLLKEQESRALDVGCLLFSVRICGGQTITDRKAQSGVVSTYAFAAVAVCLYFMLK